jgi:hypothetical protein
MTQQINTGISPCDNFAGGDIIIRKDDFTPLGYAIINVNGTKDCSIFLSRDGFKQLIQAMIEAL